MTGSKKRLKLLRLRRFWPTLACTIPWGTTFKTWIPPKCNNPWSVETQHLTNFLQPLPSTNLGKICGERECTASTRHSATDLQVFMWLGRWTILWTHHQVGFGFPSTWTKPLSISGTLPHEIGRINHTPMSSPHMGQNIIFTKGREFPHPH